MNDCVGMYWTGNLYFEGKGVEKNVEKAIEYLERASEMGNSLANSVLFQIYSSEESHWDLHKAYLNLLDAMENGVTAFTDIQKFFKDNVDTLKEIFLTWRKIAPIDSNEEVINIHNAYVNEHLQKFAEAMKKDHLYRKATCYMNNGMIWLLKVLKLYFVNQVLWFDYKDFRRAMQEDLPPLFSNVGLWIMENWLARVKEYDENKELERMIRVAIDIINKAERTD